MTTAREFLALPPERNSQLIDGEIVQDTLDLRHQRLRGELFWQLAGWVDEHPGLGEAGIDCFVLIDERNVFEPDVWFVTEAARPGRDAKWFDRPPELVAEVLPPSTRRYDIGVKRDAYERAGVTTLWLIDPGSVVAPGEVPTTPLLPGLAVDVAGLFDR